MDDIEHVRQFDLIVPNYTEGTITTQQMDNLLQAASEGTGIAGLHGGMGYAFPCNTRFQLMTGGVFAVHPGTRYTVCFTSPHHPITHGLRDFTLSTEQYYMLLDPSIEVLAASYYEAHPPEVWRPVWMPVAWTKRYGHGRVFYHSLGHSTEVLLIPEVLTLTQRGMLWAAR